MKKSWFADYAKPVAENGYHAIPTPPSSKKTYWKSWTDWCEKKPPPDLIDRWIARHPNHSLSILCGYKVIAVDIDELDEKRAGAIEHLAFAFFGDTPLIRYGQAPKRLLLYAVDGGPIRSRQIENVDILADKRYLIAYGIHPGTQKPYRWASGAPHHFTTTQLPSVTAERVEEFERALRAFYGEPGNAVRGHREAYIENGEASLVARVSPVGTASFPQDDEGRVIDHRDCYLNQLVWHSYLSGRTDEDSITFEAWSTFVRTADLKRPMRNGHRPWSMADARAKARATLRRNKPLAAPVALARAKGGDLTPDVATAFIALVTLETAEGRLAPAALKLSNAMLDHIGHKGCCYETVTNLARETCLSEDTIKKRRRELVKAGLWSLETRGDDAAAQGCYRPILSRIERPLLPPDNLTSSDLGVDEKGTLSV